MQALTLPSQEHERAACPIIGMLHLHPVPALDYVQCWVDGVQVDGDTVQEIS